MNRPAPGPRDQESTMSNEAQCPFHHGSRPKALAGDRGREGQIPAMDIIDVVPLRSSNTR